ncbi:hypothetical protein AAIH46_13375 [Rhizobium sp. 0TCS1.26]|uniref:hypothetical protein n=1 Tax=Rhizobium sp. 0TCS1.26 TaxID=3142623 RepID=UPI003D2DEE90
MADTRTHLAAAIQHARSLRAELRQQTARTRTTMEKIEIERDRLRDLIRTSNVLLNYRDGE